MRVFTSLAGLTLAISTSLGMTPSLPTSQVSQTSEETTVTKPVRSFAKIADSVLHSHGRIQAFVRINKLSGLEQKERTLQSLRRGRSGLNQLAQQQIASTKAEQAAQASLSSIDSVLAALQKLDPQARLLFKTKYTLSGFAVSADAKALSTLASRSGDVLRISALPMHESTAISTKEITKRIAQLQNTGSAKPSNYNSDGLVRAVQTWQETGKTGKGVNIAIVDTGLDYTHADFGGPGTEQAYKTAFAKQNVDPLKNPTLSKLLDKNKFKGGYDFAGAHYGEDGNTHADPDPNPIDGPGGHHGTHVAGTAAGYGVQSNHKTYRGNYKNLTTEDIAKWQVGPGSAPEAGIYSLKVFGDYGGSTNLVLPALDWVAKHNVEATKQHHMNDYISIVSMSLGGSFGSPDDPENAAVNNLAKAGVLSVIAAGNDGDISDVLGAPATASSSLTVAASQSGKTIQDSITVSEGPASLKGHKLAGQYSANYAKKANFTLTAKVVRVKDPKNLEGCNDYSKKDAAAVKGNIAYINWNDDQITCGSAQRFTKAAKAGAVGVLFGSNHNIPEAGIAGNETIPGFQLVKRAAENTELQHAIDAGTLKVTLSSAQSGTLNADYSNDYADTIASFTSRGIHGSFDGTVKPDVAAPGVGIISASAGTGYKHEVMSGTSMATPLTAGVAALVKQSAPKFTPQEIKSQIINTATHDVTSEDHKQVYSPLRVGTGRVDAYAAVTNDVLVYAADNPEAVTAQFGVIQVPSKGYTAKKTFKVTNTGSSDRTYTVKYLPRTQTPGVNYTLSTNAITVKSGATASFDITLSIPNQSALRHTRDMTQKPEAVKGFERQYVTDASGVVELTPANQVTSNAGQSTLNTDKPVHSSSVSKLRVAVSSAPKPYSETQTYYNRANNQLIIRGHGINQGEGAEAYKGSLTPLIFAGDDTVDGYYGDPAKNATRSLASADIRAFGYSSTAPQLKDPSKGVVNFGFTTDKYWNHLGNSLIPTLFIVASDTENGVPRIYETTTSTRSDKGQMTDRTEIKTYQIDPASHEPVLKDTQLLDNAFVYDSNMVVFPVKLSALGFTKNQEHAYISYELRMDSPFAEANDYQADTAGDPDANRFDAYHPDVWFGTKQGAADTSSRTARTMGTENTNTEENGVSNFADVEGTVIPVHIAENYKGDKLQTFSIHSLGYAPNAGYKYTAGIDNITPVKKDALQDSVDRYQKLDKSPYTPETWKTFETALAKAKQVLADPNASQEDVDAAYNKLQEAYNGLVKVAPPVSKDKLSAEVTADKTLKQSDYTPATWEAFDKALKNAQSVLDNPKATQEEVNTALDKLTKARESLAKKEAPAQPTEPGKSNPAQPTTPGKSDSGSSSTPGSNKPGSQEQQPGNSESKKNDHGSANKQVLTKSTKTKLSQTGTSITILAWTLMTAAGLSITAIMAKRKASKQRS